MKTYGIAGQLFRHLKKNSFGFTELLIMLIYAVPLENSA